MNRLWVRLTLAFAAVIAVSLVIVAVLAESSVGTEFAQYLARRDQLAESGMLDTLVAFYQQKQSWQGVDTIIDSQSLQQGHGQGRGQGVGQGLGMMRGRPFVLVADASGQIVYDESGERTGRALTAAERSSALPIQDGATLIGYFTALPNQMVMSPVEQNFLDKLRGTLLIAALTAGMIGLTFSFVISHMIAQPLSRLEKAATALAHNDRTQRAPETGTAEVARVAHAFNTMADALEQAEMLRRNLMADIAHELRTPLTVMQGSLDAMLNDVYPLERSEIANIYDETRLLSRLVDDVRELALADAGQLRLNMQTVNIEPLLKNAVATFAMAAEAHGVTVVSEIAPSLPMVKADPDRLSQVLHNLLANALRHTPGGTITVCGEPAQADGTPNDTRLRITVADTGEGIPAEDLPHVFDRFYRGNSPRSNGTGLGLAIAKAWITAMQGEIAVKSTAGTGSTFKIMLQCVANRSTGAVPGAKFEQT